MATRVLRYCTGLGLVGLTLSAPAYCQTITANVEGSVTDSSGAVIAGAIVSAINVDTDVAVSATTSSAGTYSIRFLQIGNYKVTVQAKGFELSSYGPYKLEVSQVAHIDAKLQVGAASETMVVSGALAPILDTDNSQIDATFDANTIQNIPLNGQNFNQVLLYMPGAVSTQPSGFAGVGSVERETGSSGQVSVNGNRLQTNNYLWDGVEVNETINNLVGYAPTPDAIQEIKVVAANPNAEYGNANGGDVIMVMKSGTNEYHGNAFYHLENYELDANTWANKHVAAGSAIAPRATYTQSQFGGTLGGPVIKDKLFFFADFSAGRFHQGAVQQLYVASAKMRNGDFSELLDPAYMCFSGDSAATCQGRLIQLYDPSNNYAPYANNQNVPIVNPVAKYLYAHPELYPLPNHAPDPGSPVAENFFGKSNSFNLYNQGDVRVDYVLGQKDRFMAHFTQAEGSDGTSSYPVPVFFQNGSKYPDKVFVASDVHTFSSSVVNEFRAGYSRIRWEQGNPIDTSGVFGLHGNATVGICDGCSQPFEGFSAQNVSELNTPGNPAGGTNFIDNTFHFTETLTWSHGNHNSKFGAELVRYQQNNFYPGNDGALGNFTYNGNFSSNPITGSPGYAVADFVLDRVYRTAIGGVTGRTGQRQWRDAYYAQDDWRILPKLTLNLGLRYEYDQPIYEVNNKTANVNFATDSVEYAGSIPAANTVAGATVCPTRACYNATYGNVMPRVGFAYAATDRFVVRGGYGITNFLEGTGANLRLTYNPPFQPSFEIEGVAPTATSAGTSFRVENGFSPSATPNYSGTTYRAWASDLRPAFISTFSLSTQYEINNKSSLTIAYVGEAGGHLIQAVAANQLTAPCIIGGAIQSNPNSTACESAAPAPFQTLVGQSGSVVETASEGMYNYNALQTQYRQRVMTGLEFTANYTYGRAMTNTDGFFGVPNINGPSPYAENAYDNHAEYGPVGQDIRNNANGTAVYQLPVGRGRTFGSNMNRGLDEAIGGWQISIAGAAYSGFPVTAYSNTNNAFTNNRTDRPNQYFRLPIHNRSINSWFGTDPSATACQVPGATVNSIGTPCAFGIGANGTYGTARPNSLRGPGFQNYDASLSKDFAIVREYKLGFRADGFNALNHTSYSNPDSTVTDSTFGQISSVRSSQRQIQLSANLQF